MAGKDTKPIKGAYTGLAVDPSMGRQLRVGGGPGPFNALATPLRARQAVDQAQAVAGVICALHIFGALWIAFAQLPNMTPLPGRGRFVLTALNTWGALLALYFFEVLRQRPSVPVAWALVAWTAILTVPVLPLWLYGYAAQGLSRGFMALGVIGAVTGLRGAYKLRRFQREASTGPVSV